MISANTLTFPEPQFYFPDMGPLALLKCAYEGTAGRKNWFFPGKKEWGLLLGSRFSISSIAKVRSGGHSGVEDLRGFIIRADLVLRSSVLGKLKTDHFAQSNTFMQQGCEIVLKSYHEPILII
jgi:hypothetical protein